MIVKNIEDDIHQAYIRPDTQLRLFNSHPRQVCHEIGLNWLTALHLRDKGWLSFDPETKTELEEHNEAELLFLGSLVAWGLDENQLSILLDGLRKPYSYRMDMIYFDWLEKRWRLLPRFPTSDEIEDVIDMLRDDGDTDYLKSLHEKISNSLGINNKNYRDEIITSIAMRECKRISPKIIRHFQTLTDGMQSGDDTPLKNIWDEICVQVQGQESVFWDVYLDTIHSTVLGEIENLNRETKQAIWLQTDAGVEWQMDYANNDTVTFCDDDIVNYIVSKFVLSTAADWTNKRIEKFLEREYY